MSTYVPSLKDQFHARVQDYMRSTSSDFSRAWQACKCLESDLWNRWQAETKAANEAGQKPAKDTTQVRAEALAEFTRTVNEEMQSAGLNYGAAWAQVQQKQPRLYAQMMGDMASDHALAEAGLSAPVIRK